jgi:mRNA interferase RelE/StbE
MPEGQKEKLREALNVMKNNAFNYPYQKIQGESHLYRIRIGDYRVLYEIDDPSKTIMVIKVDHRNKVYK